MAEEPRYTEAQSGWCAPPSGLVARGERGSIHYNSGGVVHGPGEGVPIRVDLSREHLLTAAQVSARAAEYVQAVNDAPPRPNYCCYYCHQPIRVMVNRGTGVCSEQCRKALSDAN